MPAGILVDRHSVAGTTQQHHGLNHMHEATVTANGTLNGGNVGVFGHESTAVSRSSASTQFTLDLVKLAANLAAAAGGSGDSPTARHGGNTTSSSPSNPSPPGSAMLMNGSASSPVFGRPSTVSSSSSSSTVGSSVDGSLAAATAAAVMGVSGQTVGGRKSVNMTECVPVPSSEHVAEIVGRQGSKIKALRAKTNTYIKTPVRGEEPVFVVTGRREDVAAARREILSASEHFSQIRASRLGAGPASPFVGTSSSGHVGQSVSNSPAGDGGPNQVTIQVRVPYRVVGLVVGPKGATIKRIQQDSSTYIVTPSRDREPVFEVTGTPDGVEKARRDIESYIAIRTGATAASESPGYSVPPLMSQLLAGTSGSSDCPELDAQTLFGTFLKTGLVAGSNLNTANNNSSMNNLNTSASLLLSYNNAMNQLRSNPVSLPDFIGHSKSAPLVSASSIDMHSFTNGSLRAALENSMSNDTTNVNNNNLILSSPDAWSPTLASLLPMVDELSIDDSIGRHGLPSLDDHAGLGSLDVLLPSSNYSICRPSGAVLSDDMTDAFQIQQMGMCPQMIGSSVESSLVSSASHIDSVNSVPHHSASLGLQSCMSMNAVAGVPATMCFLCSEASVTSALVPCGHNLYCKDCADAVVSRSNPDDRRCPACDEPASLAIRILS